MGVRYSHMLRGVVCSLAGGTCWGFSAVCAEVLMNSFGISVNWISCIRVSCAAVFFLCLTAATQREKLARVFKDGKSLLLILGFAILGILLTQVSYLNAIHYAGAGTALLLERLGLALIMLVLCFRARRLPHKREFVGLLCALFGVVLIATQGDLTSLKTPLLGLAWGLLSAVALMFYNLMPVRPLAKYGSFLVTGVAMLFASIAAFVCFQPWNYPLELPPYGWFVLVLIVTVGTIMAYMLFVQGINDAGPMRAGLLGSIEPVSGMVISALWIGKSISVFDLLGAACIIAMIVLVTQREESAEVKEYAEPAEVAEAAEMHRGNGL